MKTRVKSFLAIAIFALTAFATQSINASEATAPAHAKEATPRETVDSLTHHTTKKLIESVGELSRTASKLSETALKLLEAQEAGVSLQPSNPQNKKTEGQRANQSIPTSQQPKDNLQEANDANIGSLHQNLPIPAQVVVHDTIYISVPDTLGRSSWNISEANPYGEQYDGGRLMWIPDNDFEAVSAILNGKDTISESDKIDLSEMTLWRGDSIPMALHTKRLGRYDRKLYNWLIYPKGLWHIGLTANYGELNTEDMEILSLIDDVDLKGKIYSIKPSVSYFLRNNLCVGMRLAFTKGDMGINSFKVDIDEDMNFNLHDIRYTSDSYAAAIFLQQYFGLSRRGRFAVFNEVEMAVGTGNTHFIRPFDSEIRDTRTKTQSFNINYSPGVSIMMMKNAAFNLSFGIFGFHLKDEKQWENGEESGSRFTSGINFRFNIFNINFGVSIII